MKHGCMVWMCLLGAVFIAGCQTGMPVDFTRITGGGLSDEEKIALVLDDVQRGMEERRIYLVLAHVSRNYKDREGRDYNMLSEDLATLLRNYRSIRITRTPPRILVQGDRARVIDTFGAGAESTAPIEFAPINLQGQVSIMMERFGNTWQIVEWGPIT